jgi:hypothetical protein
MRVAVSDEWCRSFAAMIAEDMCTQAGDQEEDAPYVLSI